MSEFQQKLAVTVTGLIASSTALAGALPPAPAAPVAAPVMGPWTLGIMAVLVASVAYWIKKK